MNSDKEKEWQRKNAELQKLVDEKTADLVQKYRDLEIEASLERVRAVALSMKKPDDLLSICKVLYAELLALGFTELRNAMINIHDDDAGSFLNYDFSNAAGPTVTTIFYNSHPATESLVKQIRKKNDAFAEFAIKGSELDKWREYRKAMGEKDDPKLDNVSSLHYYFYSIGTGGIGISNYGPINEGKLDLLKRFRNVFELAYRRYMDVAQAEAQVREAKIEVSLERIRARSMAMQKSDELVDASTVLFDELKKLGIETIRTGVAIVDTLNETLEIWSSQLINEKRNRILGVVPFKAHPFFEDYYEAWKRKEPYFFYEVSGDEVEKYYKKMSSILSYPKKKKFNLKESFQTFFFPEGSLNVVSLHPLNEDECNLMIRFARVFGLIYRRFLDLQKAEAQVREAQIQLSLERVRARTMAMHSSDELQEAAILLFQQLSELGVDTGSCGYVIWENEDKNANVWMSSAEGGIQNPFKLPHTKSKIYKEIYSAKEEGKEFFVKEVRGAELKKHFDYLTTVPGIGEKIKQLRKAHYKFPETIVYNIAFFKQGYLSFHTHEQNSDAYDIFRRFANVFEQTYTRFLDLQKAEAQAKEAQIEAALERVRNRTMAMQKSEELKEVIQVVYEQFVNLNILVDHAGFDMDYKAGDDHDLWITDKLGSPSKVTVPYFDCVYYNRFKEAKEKGEDFFAMNLTFDEKNKFYQKLIELVPGIPDESKKFLFNCPGLGTSTVLLDNVGLYIENFSGIPYSDEENVTLMRFGKVFQQTYTRFLDLQKAEAQVRESKIEAALERVRSKTMAMHNSREVGETIAVMFDEFRKLGIETYRCGIGIMDEAKEMETWAAKSDKIGKVELIIGYLDMSTHPLLKGAFNNWKNKKESYYYQLKGKDLIKYFTAINRNENYPVTYDLNSLPKEIFHNDFYFNEGTLFVFTLKKLTSEDESTFKRFAGVFGQTYRRYLDLQKAEAQAREAQIEASLERVRARTMAMHSSNDVSLAIVTLFTELERLGIENMRCGIATINNNKTMEVWSVTNVEDGKTVKAAGAFDMSAHKLWKLFYNSWQKKSGFLHYYLSGKEKQDYIKILNNTPNYL
ncbi:MAG: hypothetical protein ABIY50_12805, partial [Ignavibacteria bacterium]